MSEATAKRHMGLRTSRAITNTVIHILLIAISIICKPNALQRPPRPRKPRIFSGQGT